MSSAHGLHARPAARLVQRVSSFDADVSLTNLDSGGDPVDAGSLSRVATIDAGQGTRVRVEARGADAAAAVRAVVELADRAFGDNDKDPSDPGEPAHRDLRPPPVTALDMAMGPVIVPPAPPDLTGYQPGDVEEEGRRLEQAIGAGATDLEQLQRRAAQQLGGGEADIFAAQSALLHDDSVTDQARSAIGDGAAATQAWANAMDESASRFESLADAYQRARAQDVRSVRDRVLRRLAGVPVQQSFEHGVLVVPELDAATAATLDPERVHGVVTMAGGATGHGVIVAKSRGIPVITDVGTSADVAPGVVVAFDASTGEFLAEPDADERRRFETMIEDRVRRRTTAIAAAEQPAITTDGCRIAVLANIGSVEDAAVAGRLGADGAGLVRTEVLFGDHTAAPDRQAQADAYLAIAAALPGRLVTIRTWDVGGDKPLPFFPMATERNPFLGERGIRVFRRRPDMLVEQLQAVWLASRRATVRVMFPMVSTLDELTWAREQLQIAAQKVTQSTTGREPGHSLSARALKVGVMVEVPAAALRIATLGEFVDFVSIGTNDLTQYALAADRGNGAVAGLADSLDPAVLSLIDRVCSDAPAGVEVAVCGDVASDPPAAVLLVGLGVRELSVTAPSVPLVKQAVRDTSLAAAQQLARSALRQRSAADVRRLLATSQAVSDHPGVEPSPC
ncbi:MAG: phosphoenolpyruvate--protein phosphotransferase [Nocardioidaceae bacterium]